MSKDLTRRELMRRSITAGGLFAAGSLMPVSSALANGTGAQSVYAETKSPAKIVRGKVARLTPFGAFVELAEGIEGLCHISEIEDRRNSSKDDTERQAPLAGAC